MVKDKYGFEIKPGDEVILESENMFDETLNLIWDRENFKDKNDEIWCCPSNKLRIKKGLLLS